MTTQVGASRAARTGGCGAALHAFDDDIAGTGSAWYTPAELNDRLGSADVLFLHAATTGVTGSGPTLTCQVEHSGNGEDWVAAGGGPQIGPIAIGNDGAYGGSIDGIDGSPLLGLVRIKITLGGTTPACRLKLHIAGDEWIIPEASRAQARQRGWPSFEEACGKKAGCGGEKDCGCGKGGG